MQQTRSHSPLVAALIVLAAASRYAMAGAADDFLAQYRSAEPKIEAAYANVDIDCVYQQYDDADQHLLMQNDVSMSVAGNQFSQTSVARIESSTGQPAGTLNLYLGRPNLWLTATKSPEATDFTFARFQTEPKPREMDEFKRIRCAPATAAYSVQASRVIDLLNLPAWHFLSADDIQFAGKPMVKVTLASTAPAKAAKPRTVEIIFDPADWCVVDYTVQLPQRTLRGHVDYFDDATFPRRVKSTETWSETPTQRGRVGYERYDIVHYDFATPSPEHFTLTGLGVNTMPPPEMVK